ncbi:hypothetical protein JCM8547_002087 [Rhodosporidiobolus lusitaniae]
MPDPAPARTKRAYAFACRLCKSRKTKCSGPTVEGDPSSSCAHCLKANRVCEYGSAPAGEGSKSGNDRKRPRSITAATGREEEVGRSRSMASPGHSPVASCSSHASSALVPLALDVAPGGDEGKSDTSLALNEHGQALYHGSTSHLHDGVSAHQWAAEQPPVDVTREVDLLRSSSRMQSMWEKIVYQNLRSEEPDFALKEDLLKAFWCWQVPTHLAVYRPLLVRDMALSGPHSSPFLLNVIYAHACRYTSLVKNPEDTSKGFLSKAKLLLLEEMERPTSIPTIQGLIILGGRECAVGRSSQGWLYTGMAIRMLKDLGIHLDGENLGYLRSLPVEEREVRRRLFWSLYTWDKSISLTLGRGPTFHEMGGKSPSHPVDDTDDDTLWEPHSPPGIEPPARLKNYPPQPALTSSTFRSFCQLSEILNSILLQLYVSGPRKSTQISTRNGLDARLDDWWTEVKQEIKLEDLSKREWAPPPHILNLNLLRHAARILLYRPFIGSTSLSTAKEAASVSSESSRAIDSLLRLHVKTFGYDNLIYLSRYCVYVGATVAAHDVKRSIDEADIADAAARLSFGLRALEAGAFQSPAFLRSLLILRRQVRNPPISGGAGLAAGKHPLQDSPPSSSFPAIKAAQPVPLAPASIPYPPSSFSTGPPAAPSSSSSGLFDFSLPAQSNHAATAPTTTFRLPAVLSATGQATQTPPAHSRSTDALDGLDSWWTLPLFPEQQQQMDALGWSVASGGGSQVEIPPMASGWDFLELGAAQQVTESGGQGAGGGDGSQFPS